MTKKKQANPDLAAHTADHAQKRFDELTELLIRFDAAREHERQTLASELHGTVVSSLSAIKMECDWLVRARQADQEAVGRLSRVCDTLLETIQFTRRIIDQLWPAIVQHLGLAAAIKQQIADFNARSKAQAEAVVEADVDDIPQTYAIVLYRSVQQVLGQLNAGNEQAELRVTLRRVSAGVELEIADLTPNSRAFASYPADSDALLLVQERVWCLGGQLDIGGVVEGGTRMRVFLPLLKRTDQHC